VSGRHLVNECRTSSPAPLLLTRLDTGHKRRRSWAAGLSRSIPAVPSSHRQTSALDQHAARDRRSQDFSIDPKGRQAQHAAVCCTDEIWLLAVWPLEALAGTMHR
jgi:hypothetical protein